MVTLSLITGVDPDADADDDADDLYESEVSIADQSETTLTALAYSFYYNDWVGELCD